jgi:hypothetical protein
MLKKKALAKEQSAGLKAIFSGDVIFCLTRLLPCGTFQFGLKLPCGI